MTIVGAVLIIALVAAVILLACYIHTKKSKEAVNLRDRHVEVQRIDNAMQFN
jgi:uncharacterized membrane protein